MGEWDFLDKLIDEESERVDSFYFDDPLVEDTEPKKKAGRPKQSPDQKGNKLLKKACAALDEAVLRLRAYHAAKNSL